MDYVYVSTKNRSCFSIWATVMNINRATQSGCDGFAAPLEARSSSLRIQILADRYSDGQKSMGNWGYFTLLYSGYFTPFITGSGAPPLLEKKNGHTNKKSVLQTRSNQKRWATKKNEKGRAVSTWEISMQKNRSFFQENLFQAYMKQQFWCFH